MWRFEEYKKKKKVKEWVQEKREKKKLENDGERKQHDTEAILKPADPRFKHICVL